MKGKIALISFSFLFSIDSFSEGYIVKLRNQNSVATRSNTTKVISKQLGLIRVEGLPQVTRSQDVVYIQKDHPVSLRFGKKREPSPPNGGSAGSETLTPNDTEFSRLWSLHGQTPGKGNIAASSAWIKGTGGETKSKQEIVIAIVDGGFDVTHPDLVENLWVNTKEIPNNGIDDDGNGVIDDIHGFNAYSGDGNLPVADHGTHVTGIAGARGNNGKGVTGVNWKIKVMLVAASSGNTSVVISGYDYILSMKKKWIESNGQEGANVVAVNSSFGIDFADCKNGQYPAWDDAYNEMGKAGILNAVATINANENIDEIGDVPSGCSSPYLLSVTNTNSNDDKYSSAGYGKNTIDLGAPGTSIVSTVPGQSYRTMTGTSMATPHVTGSVGYLWSRASQKLLDLYSVDPARAALEMKKIVTQSVDSLSGLQGKTKTGGRLNLFKASEKAESY